MHSCKCCIVISIINFDLFYIKLGAIKENGILISIVSLCFWVVTGILWSQKQVIHYVYYQGRNVTSSFVLYTGRVGTGREARISIVPYLLEITDLLFLDLHRSFTKEAYCKRFHVQVMALKWISSKFSEL